MQRLLLDLKLDGFTFPDYVYPNERAEAINPDENPMIPAVELKHYFTCLTAPKWERRGDSSLSYSATFKCTLTDSRNMHTMTIEAEFMQFSSRDTL